jgi:hypothetical protein
MDCVFFNFIANVQFESMLSEFSLHQNPQLMVDKGIIKKSCYEALLRCFHYEKKVFLLGRDRRKIRLIDSRFTPMD